MLSPYHPLQLTWGLIVWCVYFSVMYGALSVVCATAPPGVEQGAFTWLNFGLLLFTLITGAWLFYQAWRCLRIAKEADPAPPAEHRRRDAGSDQLHKFRGFLGSLAAGTNLIAGLATIAVGAPVAVLSPCL